MLLKQKRTSEPYVRTPLASAQDFLDEHLGEEVSLLKVQGLGVLVRVGENDDEHIEEEMDHHGGVGEEEYPGGPSCCIEHLSCIELTQHSAHLQRNCT